MLVLCSSCNFRCVSSRPLAAIQTKCICCGQQVVADLTGVAEASLRAQKLSSHWHACDILPPRLFGTDRLRSEILYLRLETLEIRYGFCVYSGVTVDSWYVFQTVFGGCLEQTATVTHWQSLPPLPTR